MRRSSLDAVMRRTSGAVHTLDRRKGTTNLLEVALQE